MWAKTLSQLSRPPIFFLFALVAVILLQPYKIGFEKGHHGWVSSHTLSIISRAAPENLFLGYTRDEMTTEGLDRDYFDRYPVIFSGTFHLLLKPFWDNLAAYTYLSRQLMNLIFLLTGILLFRLARSLTKEEVALAATAFVMSSAYFVRYKDMVHFDQPALVGCLLVLNGIVDYELKGKRRWLYLGIFIGPLLGRGYASIVFLGTWYLIRIFRQRSIFNQALLFLCLSIPLPTLMLGWNIYSEAQVRDVPVIETSIVKSARHRLGLEKYKVRTGGEKEFRWGSFVSNQVQRALDFTTPQVLYGIHVKNYKNKLLHYTSLIPKLLFQLFLVYFLLKHRRRIKERMSETLRSHLYLLVFSGILWIALMRHLANYHDYVSLYLFGGVLVIGVIFSEAIAERKPKLLQYIPLIFLLSLGINFIRESLVASEVNWQNDEFQKLRAQMKKHDLKVAYIGENYYDFMDGVPHAPDYMLSDFALTTKRELGNISVKVSGQTLETDLIKPRN